MSSSGTLHSILVLCYGCVLPEVEQQRFRGRHVWWTRQRRPDRHLHFPGVQSLLHLTSLNQRSARDRGQSPILSSPPSRMFRRSEPTQMQAGIFGTWYFSTSFKLPRSAGWAAFKRSVTTSFGSICFGSLIVALLDMLRAALRLLQNQAAADGNMFFYAATCIANCCLGCISWLVEFFNRSVASSFPQEHWTDKTISSDMPT